MKMAHKNVTKLLCMLQALAIQLAENVTLYNHIDHSISGVMLSVHTSPGVR
jgi:hypothetical protein